MKLNTINGAVQLVQVVEGVLQCKEYVFHPYEIEISTKGAQKGHEPIYGVHLS